MYSPTDMRLWTGRVDREESLSAIRWHQKIKTINDTDRNAIALLGFCCDEGVIRNQGRAGAQNGPNAIRRALANQVYLCNRNAIDAGNIICVKQQLEKAQLELADKVKQLLAANHIPVIVGGGHEIALGSYLGIESYLSMEQLSGSVGIINFDAHLDLRTPSPLGNSGTPFRQIAEHCNNAGRAFNYCVVGMNPTANTAPLLQFAKENDVLCIPDTHCTHDNLTDIATLLTGFLSKVNYLYMSICLDVFPASYAPGVSAPAALGVTPHVVIQLLQTIKTLCKQHNVQQILTDIAEMNPEFDNDNKTAKLAARIIHEILWR